MEFELFDAERKKNKCPMILAFATNVIDSIKQKLWRINEFCWAKN